MVILVTLVVLFEAVIDRAVELEAGALDAVALEAFDVVLPPTGTGVLLPFADELRRVRSELGAFFPYQGGPRMFTYLENAVAARDIAAAELTDAGFAPWTSNGPYMFVCVPCLIRSS